MNLHNLAQFQTLPTDKRLAIAMSLFESYILSKPKFKSLQVSSIDPVGYSEFPISLMRVYDWIGKFVLKEKSDDTGPVLPFDSNSIEWAIPGISLPGFSSVGKDRSVIAWIPGGPYRWEVELNQPDSNSVYMVDYDHLDEFPDDCPLNPMNLSDFITTFLLSESIRRAAHSVVERIDPRIQDQCNEIISASQTSP